jgi:hypothetical protein
MEASKRADFFRKIHVQTKEAIEKGKKMLKELTRSARRCCLSLEIWFGYTFTRTDCKSKLLTRGVGPYEVIAKINDNAYKIDTSQDVFGYISNSFNVADLTPYDGEDLGVSRSTPFEGGR